jgi:hypothetical protein
MHFSIKILFELWKSILLDNYVRCDCTKYVFFLINTFDPVDESRIKDNWHNAMTNTYIIKINNTHLIEDQRFK